MNNTRLIVNFILALFVLIILCNSRRVEKYMEGEEKPVVEEETMEVVEEPVVEEETMEVVEEPMMAEETVEVVEEPMMDEDSMPEMAVQETDVSMAVEPEVGMMDATSVDLSLPAVETPVADGVELGYYDFSKVMYF